MSQQLAGKVALVTGGSRGIGAAIVNRLVQDGAAVALTYAASPDARGMRRPWPCFRTW
jgi:3-oxoacyl-[acyl-carrier protein] reductase